ncbi:MAG: Arv1-like family [Lasallia pustulata]|uniref:Protein ARV n=1 Tax=Lasallia pustulata TaxID=136370 RepID=A0A5M8Q0M6_9LECA|nr:MAG: Arv1-like family [Lasallia pustulata]
MPICIECHYPVPQLYHVLHSNSANASHPSSTGYNSPNNGKNGATVTGTTSLSGGTVRGEKAVGGAGWGAGKRTEKGKKGSAVVGGDVRLTQCPRCKRRRHLLFNRLGREDDEFDPSIPRLGTLLLLFDVYLTWSRIESLPAHLTARSPIPSLPILLQYAFYLLLCTLTTLSQHLTIRSLAPYLPLPNTPPGTNGKRASCPNALSTALFVSSSMKLFPILMVVWKYDDTNLNVKTGVDWAVAIQNIEAVRILLGCGYVYAAILVGAGALARWVVGRIVLGAVGLGDVGR